MVPAEDAAIHTDRLVVRRFRPDDWRDLLAYLSLPETFRFEPGEPIDAEHARALAVERSIGRAFWAVGLLAERRVIGHLHLATVEPAELQTYELGFSAHRRVAGRASSPARAPRTGSAPTGRFAHAEHGDQLARSVLGGILPNGTGAAAAGG